MGGGQSDIRSVRPFHIIWPIQSNFSALDYAHINWPADAANEDGLKTIVLHLHMFT